MWIFSIARRFLFGPTLHLWRHPVGFICVISIALAMASTLVTQSVIRGFEHVYEKSILGFNAHLVITSWEAGGPVLAIPELDTLVASGEVHAYSPFSVLEAMALAPGHSQGVMIKGIDQQKSSQTYQLHLENFPISNSASKLVPVYLGKQLYRELFPAGVASSTLSLMLGDHIQSSPWVLFIGLT